MPCSRKTAAQKPRQMPTISVEFVWGLSGEPVGHTATAKPGSKVGALLAGLCAATGRNIEETALVFETRCLENGSTLARSGLRGNAQLGVVLKPPAFVCPVCGGVTEIPEMREYIHKTREARKRLVDRFRAAGQPEKDLQKMGGWCPTWRYNDNATDVQVLRIWKKFWDGNEKGLWGACKKCNPSRDTA